VQVVGRRCDVCALVINSELVGVACERCQRVFHDACAAPSSASVNTYRDPSPPKDRVKRAKVKAPASTSCPTCGDDVRAVARARDRERHQARALGDAQRRGTEARKRYGLGVALGLLIVVRVILMMLRES
jgi:hypothetical protein